MKSIFFAFLAIPISCMMTNNPSNSEINTNSIPGKFTEMTAIKNNKCQFLLQDKESVQYEVQQITTKMPNLSNGKKVWITFQPLRRMSVCGAQPIEIIEVYKK